MSEKLRFTIELHRCNFDGSLFLTVPTADDGGVRISEHKPVTSELVRKFRVGISKEDLDAACRYAEKPKEGK